jgi:hypothetical protein
MPQDELRTLIEIASAIAERAFQHTGGRIIPMWHAVAADGKIQILPAPHDLDQFDITQSLRDHFAENNIVRYVFISEAWSLRTDDVAEYNKWRREYRSLKDHPKRKEIMTFFAEDLTMAMIAERAIIRPSREPPRLGKLCFEDIETLKGYTMMDILPRPNRTLQ